MGIFGLSTRKEVELEKRIAVMESQHARSSTLQNPSVELVKALQDIGMWGPTNDSGATVTDKTVVGIAAFARGLNLIGDGIASMPLKRYRKFANKREELPDNLISRPNPWQTQYQWVKYMAIMQASRGNAYSHIVRDTRYKATMTIPIHPRYVKPVVVEGDLFYRVDCDGFPSVIHHTDMIHWKGMCYDNLIEGISPIVYHAQTLGITISAEKGQARTNKSNSKQFILHGESGKPVPAEVKKSLMQDVNDVMNYQSPGMFMPNGIKLDFMTMTPQEAQFIEQRQYGAVDIARILNIPSSLLDADNGGNKSSVEQESLNFYTLTLHPKTTDFQQELQYKLLSSPDEYYKFNFDSLLRADVKTRIEVQTKLKQVGWNDNEIRAMWDVNGYEGGDRRYADLNQIPKDLEDEYYNAKIEGFTKGANNATGENNNTNN